MALAGYPALKGPGYSHTAATRRMVSRRLTAQRAAEPRREEGARAAGESETHGTAGGRAAERERERGRARGAGESETHRTAGGRAAGTGHNNLARRRSQQASILHIQVLIHQLKR